MTGSIRIRNICTNGGILAAILIAALFASAQVACLTHTHCDGADCFEHSEGSTAPHHGAHHEDEADHGRGQDADSCCGDGHRDHDVHHHSLDGKNHPKRRFTAPAGDSEYADAVNIEAPAPTPAEHLPAAGASPPFERYGLIFAERAPPLS